MVFFFDIEFNFFAKWTFPVKRAARQGTHDEEIHRDNDPKERDDGQESFDNKIQHFGRAK